MNHCDRVLLIERKQLNRMKERFIKKYKKILNDEVNFFLNEDESSVNKFKE